MSKTARRVTHEMQKAEAAAHDSAEEVRKLCDQLQREEAVEEFDREITPIHVAPVPRGPRSSRR